MFKFLIAFNPQKARVLVGLMGFLTILVISWFLLFLQFPHLGLKARKMFPQSELNVISTEHEQHQCIIQESVPACFPK